jgi:hypothetical protein
LPGSSMCRARAISTSVLARSDSRCSSRSATQREAHDVVALIAGRGRARERRRLDGRMRCPVEFPGSRPRAWRWV